MNDVQFSELATWVTEAGLAGRDETATLTGFCERAVELGLPIARATVLADTLHPVYEGRAFRWNRDKGTTVLTEYGRSEDDVGRWQRSPFYRLEESGEPILRRRLTAESQSEFPIFPELLAGGMTDYVALVNRFAPERTIGKMDGVYSSWATDLPSGFCDSDVADLSRLVPFLALTVKTGALAGIAATLVQTYLGRDAGRRVLAGRIARGVVDRIEAVLWSSDLRGFTRISDTSAPEAIIPLLNNYADAIIAAIHDQGGDVLKLMGDGILAIFTAEDRSRACNAALAHAETAVIQLHLVCRLLLEKNLPTAEMYLGLHIGEVFYGNIGSKERLDFTVVGVAVNEVSRIASLCRSVEQPVLVSFAFASAAGESRNRLVSVGRYALRGVSRPQELFTVDRD